MITTYLRACQRIYIAQQAAVLIITVNLSTYLVTFTALERPTLSSEHRTLLRGPASSDCPQREKKDEDGRWTSLQIEGRRNIVHSNISDISKLTEVITILNGSGKVFSLQSIAAWRAEGIIRISSSKYERQRISTGCDMHSSAASFQKELYMVSEVALHHDSLTGHLPFLLALSMQS